MDQPWSSVWSRKKLEEEVSCYSKALELDPSRAETWHNRGRILKEKKMYNFAIADYNESLRLRPNHIGTLYDKAIVSLFNAEYDILGLG